VGPRLGWRPRQHLLKIFSSRSTGNNQCLLKSEWTWSLPVQCRRIRWLLLLSLSGSGQQQPLDYWQCRTSSILSPLDFALGSVTAVAQYLTEVVILKVIFFKCKWINSPPLAPMTVTVLHRLQLVENFLAWDPIRVDLKIFKDILWTFVMWFIRSSAEKWNVNLYQIQESWVDFFPVFFNNTFSHSLDSWTINWNSNNLDLNMRRKEM